MLTDACRIGDWYDIRLSLMDHSYKDATGMPTSGMSP